MSSNLIGQTLQNKFRVDAFINSGGMGTVYRVWDMQRNVPLAMKMLHSELAEDPSILKRFKREANALKKLTHPNIVPFYGLFEVRDNYFLLQHFVDGPTLKDVLKQQGSKPMRPDQMLIYLKAVTAALGYAHASGVVHCDVKPGNVMIDRGGTIYLTDFGIARHSESTTTTLGFAGTAAYMAPEQCLGEPVTPETDIYALGVMLYEMLAGVRPFRGTEAGTDSSGGTAAERIRQAHINQEPPNPRQHNPRLSEMLAGVILKALAKAPEDRFRSTRELFDALCAAAGLNPSAVPDRVVLSADLNFTEPAAPEAPSNRPYQYAPPRIAPPSARTVAVAGGGIGLIVIMAVLGLVVLNRPVSGMASSRDGNSEAAAKPAVTNTERPPTHSVEQPTAKPVQLAAAPTATPATSGITRSTRNADWTPHIEEIGGVEMALVPAGCFDMGSDNEGESERSVHKQCLDEPFWIDVYEVTNNAFGKNGCTPGGNLPHECVTWFEAQSHCESRGARLPTEAEWEYAARGPDDLIYTWGNTWNAGFAVFRGNSGEVINPVGSRTGGVSWVGAYDVLGNVWEWVSSIDASYPYNPDASREDRNSRADRVVRGGAFSTYSESMTTSNRYSYAPGYQHTDVGFRCTQDYQP